MEKITMDKGKEQYKLTSVKIVPYLYDEFKHIAISTKITLQKLVNRSVYMYTKNEEFRNTIDNAIIPNVSGSFNQL